MQTIFNQVMIEAHKIPAELQEYFEPALCDKCFVCGLVAVFREVWRVLKPTGCAFVNLGDSYAAGGRGMSEHNINFLGRGTGISQGLGARSAPDGLKPKDLVGIPWRTAFALQADGWWLRDAIIWAKAEVDEGYNLEGSTMPGSQQDRFTSAYEFVFHLTKSKRYYFDPEAIKTKSGAMMRNVWRINPQPYSGVDAYGMYRIASPSCPVHDYQHGLIIAHEYGEQLIASGFDRNPGRHDHLSQLREGDLLSIPLNRHAFPFDETSAILHNKQMSKKDSRSIQSMIFYGTLGVHTEYMQPLARYVSKFFHKNGSNTSESDVLDEMAIDPSDQKVYHILGNVTFERPPEKCNCYYMGRLKVRQDHYAVYPEELPLRCIRAGSSERGVCPRCGKPWERIIKAEGVTIGKSWHNHKDDIVDGQSKARLGDGYHRVDLGWRATCDHDEQPVPALVLDPFVGSGTTLRAAERLGRSGVGFDLSLQYLSENARERLNLAQGRLGI